MKTKQQTKEKLRDILESLDLQDLQVSAEVDHRHRLVAVVTTPEFKGLDEADRQSKVWQPVYDQLDEDEYVLIDFIFTNTPAEEDDIERRELQEQDRLGP